MKETALLKPRIEGEVFLSQKKYYQGMTGLLIFLIMEIRPNIAFATFVTSYFVKNQGHYYTEAVKTILQYLKELQDQRITYDSQKQLLVEGYSDFNWTENKKSRKSTSEFIFMLSRGSVSWCSNR